MTGHLAAAEAWGVFAAKMNADCSALIYAVETPTSAIAALTAATSNWYLVPEIWYLQYVSQEQHKAAGPRLVSCYVLTVSDTRTEANDTSGWAIIDLLTAAGHVVAGHRIVKDEPGDVERVLLDQLANGKVDVIITTGGTGITSRDSTFEAIDRLLEKRLDGFGELFRMLSFKQIGPAAMMSRATAGVARGKIIVALPGAEDAVRLGMSELLIPELTHLVQQVSK